MRLFFHLVKSVYSPFLLLIRKLRLICERDLLLAELRRNPGLWSPTLRLTTISTLSRCVPMSVSLKPLVSDYSDL